MKKNLEIYLGGKKGIIEDVYVSELGHLKIRIFYPEDKITITENAGFYDPHENMFTKELKQNGRKIKGKSNI